MHGNCCLVQTGEMISRLEDTLPERHPLLVRDLRRCARPFERYRSDGAWLRIRSAPKLAGAPTEKAPERREVPAFSHFQSRPRLPSAVQRGGLPYDVFMTRWSIFIPRRLVFCAREGVSGVS